MKKNKKNVGIIDLKCNNLLSIYNACVISNYNVEIIDLKKKINSFDFIVLPGVGSYPEAMKYIIKNKIDRKLADYLNDNPERFLYGICLGMQLFFDYSYEYQNTKGLNFLKGGVLPFNFKNSYNTNIGWNLAKFKNNESHNFYFVHSFYCKPYYKKDIYALSNFNKFKFCSAIKKKQLLGTQFHPEKSGSAGINFLKNLKF